MADTHDPTPDPGPLTAGRARPVRRRRPYAPTRRGRRLDFTATDAEYERIAAAAAAVGLTRAAWCAQAALAAAGSADPDTLADLAGTLLPVLAAVHQLAIDVESADAEAAAQTAARIESLLVEPGPHFAAPEGLEQRR